MMSPTSAYRIRIRTGSADENALLLLAGGQLVAILVELADAGHDDERGKWAVETTFGLQHERVPNNFATAADAAIWVSNHICQKPFMLGDQLIELA